MTTVAVAVITYFVVGIFIARTAGLYGSDIQLFFSLGLFALGVVGLVNAAQLSAPLSWASRFFGAIGMMAAITWWLFLLDGASSGNWHPYLAMNVTIAIAAAGAVAAVVVLQRPISTTSSEGGITHRLDATYFDLVREQLRFTKHVEVTKQKAEVATNLSSIKNTEEQMRVHGPLADAQIAAHRGAEELKVTPGSSYDEYRLKELETRIERLGKLFDAHVEHFKAQNETELDFKAVRDVAIRQAHEAIEQNNLILSLYRQVNDVRKSNDPPAVKKRSIERLEKTISELERTLDAKAGQKQDLENLDRKDLRPNLETTE